LSAIQSAIDTWDEQTAAIMAAPSINNIALILSRLAHTRENLDQLSLDEPDLEAVNAALDRFEAAVRAKQVVS
jgi:hypothetical protein